ncbi:unnamed protein product [Soboliphyme baturini]|uniref:Secreted protein n=1 Tax=Soboliphyme baturini TaxID=241478 RepID=A0A183IGF6_9BILA|nr:unnamed protein product [Soboliphyme baturini]
MAKRPGRGFAFVLLSLSHKAISCTIEVPCKRSRRNRVSNLHNRSKVCFRQCGGAMDMTGPRSWRLRPALADTFIDPLARSHIECKWILTTVRFIHAMQNGHRQSTTAHSSTFWRVLQVSALDATPTSKRRT